MNISNQQKNGKRILFANFPADGHFNPLTGLATYLVSQGYEVSWYSSKSFAPKIKKIKIPHYPFKKAIDVSNGNFDELFPGRTTRKSSLGKLKFDIIHAFILRAPEYYADILEIYRSFPFDLMVADCAFTAIPFVKELMNIPVVSIGVFPLAQNSKDLPPNGLGMTPSNSFPGKIKQALLRLIADKVIFRQPNKVLHQLLDQYSIAHNRESVFDILVKKSDLLLQSGTPGFEYKRSDISSNVHFVGPLLPLADKLSTSQWFDARLNRYKKIILVTQGTVEKNINKLLVPVLDAYKNTNTLVIATTGGARTTELRNRYDFDNIIVEDFIPFAAVMPYADVYITNGGYGGVMLGIQNQLPMVVAGVHEGKNEICARVGYFKLGINLKTETPAASDIKDAVEKILRDTVYKSNIEKLSAEFDQYNPNERCTAHIVSLLESKSTTRIKTKIITDKVY